MQRQAQRRAATGGSTKSERRFVALLDAVGSGRRSGSACTRREKPDSRGFRTWTSLACIQRPMLALALICGGLMNGAAAKAPAVQPTLLVIPYQRNDLGFSEAMFRGYSSLRRKGYPVSVVENAHRLSVYRLLSVIDRAYSIGVRNFIIAGAELSGATTTAARRHPDAYFATVAGSAHGANVVNYCLDCRQIGGGLAGAIAAKVSRSGIVGFAGGVQAVDGSEAARFRDAVHTAAPGSKVLVGWTGDWGDEDAARRLLVSQVEAGADVVVADASIIVITAALRYPGVRVVAWMVDASHRYHNVVASVVINTDSLFARFINSAAAGRFTSGSYDVTVSDNVWAVKWARPRP